MKNKDLSQAPLAETVSYEGPLSGEAIRGRNHVTRFLGVYQLWPRGDALYRPLSAKPTYHSLYLEIAGPVSTSGRPNEEVEEDGAN